MFLILFLHPLHTTKIATSVFSNLQGVSNYLHGCDTLAILVISQPFIETKSPNNIHSMGILFLATFYKYISIKQSHPKKFDNAKHQIFGFTFNKNIKAKPLFKKFERFKFKLTNPISGQIKIIIQPIFHPN